VEGCDLGSSHGTEKKSEGLPGGRWRMFGTSSVSDETKIVRHKTRLKGSVA